MRKIKLKDFLLMNENSTIIEITNIIPVPDDETLFYTIDFDAKSKSTSEIPKTVLNRYVKSYGATYAMEGASYMQYPVAVLEIELE